MEAQQEKELLLEEFIIQLEAMKERGIVALEVQKERLGKHARVLLKCQAMLLRRRMEEEEEEKAALALAWSRFKSLLER